MYDLSMGRKSRQKGIKMEANGNWKYLKDDQQDKECAIHATPAGVFAGGAPKPSKLAVLLYYISCSFCVLGIILVVRGFFIKHVRSLNFFFKSFSWVPWTHCVQQLKRFV